VSKCKHKWAEKKTKVDGRYDVAKCPKCKKVITKGRHTPNKAFGKCKTIWV